MSSFLGGGGGGGGGGGTPPLNIQTGNYVLMLSDAQGRVEMDNSGANTLTVPQDAAVNFPIGTNITVTQGGTGSTTVVGGGMAGATSGYFGAQFWTAQYFSSAFWNRSGASGAITVIHNAGVLSTQWASAKLYKRAANEWVMTTV